MALCKFNCTPEIIALVIPQPLQSNPNIFLKRQMLGCLFSHSIGMKYNRMGIATIKNEDN
jgi:hypothetical protein